MSVRSLAPCCVRSVTRTCLIELKKTTEVLIDMFRMFDKIRFKRELNINFELGIMIQAISMTSK